MEFCSRTRSRRRCFWLAQAGVGVAWFLYLKRPDLPEAIQSKLSGRYNLLDRKYYFDDLWSAGFAGGGRAPRQVSLATSATSWLIDGLLVNGSARRRWVVWSGDGNAAQVQTGYLYHYAFAMIIGLTALLGWLMWAIAVTMADVKTWESGVHGLLSGIDLVADHRRRNRWSR